MFLYEVFATQMVDHTTLLPPKSISVLETLFAIGSCPHWLVIGNAATEVASGLSHGTIQADGQIRKEPTIGTDRFE